MDILEELSVLIRNKEIDPNAKEVDELTYLMNECGPSDDTVSNSDKKLDQMQIMVENWESMQFVFFDPETASLQLRLRDIAHASYLEGACDTAEFEVGQWLSYVGPMLRLAKQRRESLPILARFPDPDSLLRKHFADSICAALDKTIRKWKVWSDQLVQMLIAISKLREEWLDGLLPGD